MDISSRKTLAPGYELIPGLGGYKFHNEVKTWAEAREICVQEDAHLVIINSQREANALLHFWVPHPKIFNDWRNDWAHIGFHDQYVEGEYVTIFSKSLFYALFRYKACSEVVIGTFTFHSTKSLD